MPLSPYGHPMSSSSGGTATRDNVSVATIAALKAIAAADARRTHGEEVRLADGSRWTFHSTSALTGDDIVVVAPTAGSGRWLRAVGFADLGLPFTFATADGTTIWTVPTGCVFKLESAHWDITTACAGGSSSAIAVAATGHTVAGDILGGSGGDVEATLTAGRKAGTIGVKMDTDLELHAMMFVATNVFTFERVTSVFTSGAGNVRLVGALLANAGA
jgi:hypothetical protein